MSNPHAIGIGLGAIISTATVVSDYGEYPFLALLQLEGVNDPAKCLSWLKHPTDTLPFVRPLACAPITDAALLHGTALFLTFIAIVLIIWKAVDFFTHLNESG